MKKKLLKKLKKGEVREKEGGREREREREGGMHLRESDREGKRYIDNIDKKYDFLLQGF